MSLPGWINSDDFVQGRFSAHGRFCITREQGVYVYEGHGPFNEETMRALGEARAEVMRRWPPLQQRGCALVHWHGSAMMSPQAFKVFSGGYERFAKTAHRLAAVAWVGAAETEGLEMMAEHFRPLYEGNDTAFALFTQREAALAWLQRWA